MIDFCILAVPRRPIFRVNKLEKVDLQSDHIMRTLDGFLAAAVLHSSVERLKNAGILLVMDEDCVLRCPVKPETTQCLRGAPSADHFEGLALVEEDEDDGPNIEVLAPQVLERLGGEQDEAVNGNL
jgi:hypothetical protein